METLSQAAVLADDYILTHKNIGSHRLQLPSHLNNQAAPFYLNPSLGGQNQPRENPLGTLIFVQDLIKVYLRVQRVTTAKKRTRHCRLLASQGGQPGAY